MRKLLLIFILLSENIFACDCPPLAKPDSSVFAKYDAIFRGRIIARSPDKAETFVIFKVIDVFKGVVGEEIELLDDRSSDCALNFDAGQEWIIYADYRKFGKLGADMCSHSRMMPANDTPDVYAVSHHMSYGREITVLEQALGKRDFYKKEENPLEKRDLIKPSGWGMILLVIISVAALAIIYFLVNKFLK